MRKVFIRETLPKNHMRVLSARLLSSPSGGISLRKIIVAVFLILLSTLTALPSLNTIPAKASAPWSFQDNPLVKQSTSSRTSSSHAPIIINGNADFTAANGVTGGTGAASDPYVIAGWDINVSQSPWHGQYYNGPYPGIGISDTDAHFVIRNVNIYGLECTCDGASAIDIDFINVTNAVVEGSTLAYSNQAIFVWGSENLIVTGNSLSNEQVPGVTASACMQVSGSMDVVVSGNTFAQCPTGGLWVDSSNILVYHNNFLQGAVDGNLRSQDLWDNGYPSGGNYWASYTGVDDCSGSQQNVCTGPDGIGDTPYTFTTWQSVVGQDGYPLMKPFTAQTSDPQVQQTTTSLFGSLLQNTTSNTVSGTLSVTVTNSTTGQTVFSRTFSVSVSYRSSSVARFVLSVPTSSSWLGTTCSVNVSTDKASCIVSRDPDVDHNGVINLLDVSQVFLAYGSSVGDARYNRSFDLYGYGTVNLFDASLAALDYGLPVFS